MLLYGKLNWCVSTTYCRAVDVFSVLGTATNFYWGARPIFCMENLIFHLKKGYSVNYWGACSPCALSVPTALHYSTQGHG